MSLIWMDGFDLYSGAAQLSRRYTTFGNNASLQTGRFTGQGLQPDQNGSAVAFPLPSGDTLTVGFALFISGAANFGTGKNLMEFKNGGMGGTTICKLGVDLNGALRFGRGDYTTNNVCTSASGLLSANGVWHYIELVLTRSATVGAVTVYCDGAAVATASGVNTGSASIDAISMASDGSFGTTRIFDDLYVTNTAARVGERRIDTLRPSADTAQKDWTPSTGTTNFNLVNETVVNDDTNYVSSSTVGNKDLYDVADLPFTPASINAVQVTMVARKDDAGTRQSRSNLKSGATTANGATNSLASSYQMFRDMYETDPNTSAAWTASAVNAAQIGPEVVT